MARHRKNRNEPVKAPTQQRGFKKVNPNAAGIDCGSDVHYVAVPEDRDPQPVRRFGAFTADLVALAAWLKACGVTTVAIESTGVYWIPLFEILEARGIEVKVVDPRRLAQVPGRKTDVLDCQWIQQLHTFGLLAGAFRPVDQIVVLRSYMRQRDMLVAYAGQHIQHMQKALEQMNVKLTEVIADITGATGTRIIDAILAGERDPKKLAALRDERCHNDEATIALALEGNWRAEHLFALKQAVELFRFYHAKLGELGAAIESHLKTIADKSGGVPLGPRPVKRRTRGNQLHCDVRQYVVQLTGVDLTTLDGFKSGYTALDLISKIGTDMSTWPTENISRRGSACVRASRRRGQKGGACREHPAALGAFARRLRAKLGAPKAITATAHKLARVVYRMLKHGKAYSDVGAEYYERRYRERLLKSLQRRAAEMGFELLSTTTGEILSPYSCAAARADSRASRAPTSTATSPSAQRRARRNVITPSWRRPDAGTRNYSASGCAGAARRRCELTVFTQTRSLPCLNRTTSFVVASLP